MIRFLILLTFLTILAVSPPAPGVEPEVPVPEVMEPWVPWVLAGGDRRDCPLIDAGDQDSCAWPGRLELDLDQAGGRFLQPWRLYARSWVPLPGAPGQWPEQVQVKDTQVPVIERQGIPMIRLDAGDHLISGRFHWRRIPDGLSIPPATGLIDLRLDGRHIRFPRFQHPGRLWLGAGAAAADKTERDTLGLSVYRRIEDDNPLQVITRLDMDVAGRAREITLGSVLLPGGIPLHLNSPLPARLESDGRLRLQARPGHWELEIKAHHPGPVSGLTLDAADPPWPAQETWVFAAHPQLRQVEPTGAEPIDPRQTRLPAQWARLPAYLMRPGETLQLVQVRRGDADPGPDHLALQRDLWLDFGGGGYTLRDHITGELTHSRRFQVSEGLDLGQVLIEGEPSFITRLPDASRDGVEIRRGHIDLVADSRIREGAASLPASGWLLDFQSLHTRLHLPPGWDLWAVAGVDNLPDTWLHRWTLLDLFLVLIIALAAARLWSWPWGVLALAAMVLIWQEPEAPRLIWLNLLAVVALLRLLPRDAMPRLRRWLLLYRGGSLVALAVIAVPFLIDNARTGIYPQLEYPSTLPPAIPESAFGESDLMQDGAAMMESPVPDGMKKKRQVLRKSETAPEAAAPPPQPLPVIDPDAKAQTGPGVPAWEWKSYQLTWNGPVPPDHRVRLWLSTPGVNLALALARLALVLALSLKIAGWWGSPSKQLPAAAALFLAVGLFVSPTPVSAQGFPSAELLQELKARLSAPPDCLPSCVDISHMRLEAADDELVLVITAAAEAKVALPVPGNADTWTPTRVTLDGDPHDRLRRGKNGALAIAIPPGRRSIRLAGPLPPRAQIEIPLPLRPRRVEVSAATGWRVEGIDDQGRPDAQIRLVRLHQETPDSELQPTRLPPLLRVRRTLHLGVDWRVRTLVERLSAPDAPIVLDLPLIAGEQVLREGARVRGDRLLVSLSPGQRKTAWSSSLEPVDSIRLTASEDPRLSEEWRIDLGPLWHLEAEGIPAIHHQGRLESSLPTWRPWPGETLLLTLSRPQGVPGSTLTLDRSEYLVRPGKRKAEAVLELTLRSSQGGRHEIALPQGAELRRVTIDGSERPLVLQDRILSLPLVPGTQRVAIEWRQPEVPDGYYSPAAPDLKTPGVNASTRIELGQDRWILFTGGPDMGPAVLFWSLVIVLIPLAIGAARSKITPLTTLDWLLLGLGLSQAGIWGGLLVVGWIFALGLRARLDTDLSPWRFNLMQIGLILLSLAALAALVAALRQGLLGLPEMQIAGNGSTSANLDWYQDHSGPELPQVWVISVPILIYRGLMLAWALWLVHRLLGWLRWGWQGLSGPVLWRDVRLLPRRRKNPPGASASASESATAEKDKLA